ncbi:O-antigen ligase family protein [Bradyrhizobium sp. HKCCYLS20291]|uniref:O-antigen ligase family protein n=1 Tax=Bradyrhizobium sp. HKCCYLS20291 TaxID=3420766 RepID=UPI003EC06288
MTLRRAYLLILVAWVHLGDLLSAWIYQSGAVPAVAYARPLRDAIVIVTAGLCLATARMARSLWMPLLAYVGLALLALAASLAAALPASVLVGSFGTLLIPVLFFLVGYHCVRDTADIRALVVCHVTIASFSAAFGAWDIQHTEFWTETIGFPAYMAGIKGLVYGAEPDTRLPYNFFIDLEHTRRAAGLVAAPLAQGIVLAVAGVLVVATRPTRIGLWRALTCVGLAAGVWMSGTRGAMLVGTVALTGYLMTTPALRRQPVLRLLVASTVLLGIFLVTRNVVDATIDQTDGSSPGHWAAFQRNIDGFPQIPLLGYGVGAQGPIAAQSVPVRVGGGEGAIFSIAYQIGAPAALMLLVFYAVCLVRLWRADRAHQLPYALATFWLMIGLATTFITSDHLLAVSGSASLWLLTGGGMRLLAMAQDAVSDATEAAA